METHPGDGASISDVEYGAVDGRMVVKRRFHIPRH